MSEGSSKPSDLYRRPSERMLRALIEQGTDVLYLANAEPRMLYVSPAVERVLGWTPEELIDEVGFDFTHPDDRARDQQVLAEVLASPGATVLTETRARHKAGHYVDMEFHVQNRLEDPDIGALVLSARDVSERNRVRRELAAQQRQFRLLADNAHDIIALYQLKPERRMQYISPSVERILGYSPEQLLADSSLHFSLIHPADAGKLAEIVRTAPASLSKPTTLRWRKADGSTVWIELLIVPQLDENGEIIGTQSISRDVTERVLLEERLRSSQKMEALGRLAGGIAHDFNNLLAVAKLSVGRLARSRADDGDLQRDLSHIEEAVDRGINLVRRLLSFSRREEAEAVSVDLAAAIRGIEPLLRRLLPESIAIEVEVCGERPWITIAPAGLEQVIINLAVNARDAMPDGGTLTLRVSRSEGEVSLTVVDTGTGLDPDTRERLFEPFFTTKEPGAGSGLGLAVVHGVLEQSGGQISLTSRAGEGTTFTVTWPRTDQPPVEVVIGPQSMAAGRRETILLVEDEPRLRALVADILTANDYDVIVATDTEQAIAIGQASESRLDLLVSDVIMPGHSGPRVAAAVRQARPELRVLFMSGYAGEAWAEMAPTDSVLEKPFTEQQLLAAVRNVLDD